MHVLWYILVTFSAFFYVPELFFLSLFWHFELSHFLQFKSYKCALIIGTLWTQLLAQLWTSKVHKVL